MPNDSHFEGEHALPIAERQSRPRDRRPADRRSRPQRWRDAVAELVALQAEYAAWHAALPDSLQDTATAEILQEIVDLDLDAITDIQPPRGYGRD